MSPAPPGLTAEALPPRGSSVCWSGSWLAGAGDPTATGIETMRKPGQVAPAQNLPRAGGPEMSCGLPAPGT